VVKAVDVEQGLLEDACQPTLLSDPDRVRPVRKILIAEGVSYRAGVLADILIQRAPKGDVEQLRAATDPEERLLLGERPSGQEQLRAIALGAQPAETGVARWRVIAFGLDVAAAREQQTSKPAREIASRLERSRSVDSLNPSGTSSGSPPARSTPSTMSATRRSRLARSGSIVGWMVMPMRGRIEMGDWAKDGLVD